MPRVLNVEHLENKFSSLTRARESIINLSNWIMTHSEFGENIVEEWLAGLSKGFNALVMFYVANDVIINCGKKRVPQFRTMFSKVLEKAMAIPNVKEVSKDILRVIKIWQDRDIYSEEFCEDLLCKLNDKVKTIPNEPPKEEKEEHAEIISKYKKEHLFDKLLKLKYIVEEVSEKEEILKYAEEPVMPKLHALGSQDCQAFLNKINRYYATLKGLIKHAEDELAARNNVLKELNNSNIFYSSQNEDVKKVAHAYKIYGKKIKKVAKDISAKVETLPACENSAYLSDNDTSSPKSPDDGFSPMDDSSESDSINSPTSTNTPKSTNKINNEQNNKNIDVPSTTLSNRKLDQSSKLFQIWNEGQKNSPVQVSSSTNMKTSIHTEMHEAEHSVFEIERDIKNSDFQKNDPSNESFNSSVKADCKPQNDSFKNESKPSSSKKSKSKTKNSVEQTPFEIIESITKNKEFNQSECKLAENKLSQDENVVLVKAIDNSKTSICHKSVLKEDSTSQDSTTKVEIVMKTIQEGTEKDLEEIDQLLEKTLKRENIKRKIEMLLKTKNKKHCPNVEEKPVLEKNPLKISEMQEIAAPESCSLSCFEKSNENQIEVIGKNILSLSDKSCKKPLETIEPIDSEQINQVSSFLNDSLHGNVEEDKINKENFIKESQNMLKSLSNDSTLIDSPKTQSENCTIPDTEQILSDTSKKMNKDNLNLSLEKVLSSNYLSNELLKNILLKQKEISESSVVTKMEIDVKNSKKELEEEKHSKFSLPDSFFAKIFTAETHEKSNLIPGLEILEESKPSTESAPVDIRSLENSKHLPQTPKNTINIENKEDINSSNPNESQEKSEYENKSNSVSHTELTTENNSSVQDNYLEKIKENCDDIVDDSSTVASDSLKIKPTSINIESQEHSDNKLEIDENNKKNNSKNLIQTISNVLECLSRNKSHMQKGSSNFPKHKSMGISLENCCLIYGALLNGNATSQIQIESNNTFMNKFNTTLTNQSEDVTTLNSKVDFCTTTNALHGPISSTFEHGNIMPEDPSNGIKTGFPALHVSEDNFQVADMDCDSE